MDYLTLGQYTIPVTWIAFFVALFYSDWRNKQGDAVTKKLLDRAFWLYILVWKFSYLAISWQDFLQAPLSLVYFDGGLIGHMMALIAIGILLLRFKEALMWSVVWYSWARFVAVFQLLVFALTGDWLLLAIWFVVLVFIEMKFTEMLLVVQWFLLLWIGGWSDTLVLAQALLLFLYLFEEKRWQQLALIGVLSMIAMTITDFHVSLEQTTVTREQLQLTTTTGEQYRFSEQKNGVTIVNFFTTWCPPCQAEMPHLQSFSESLPADVALIGVNLTARDDGPKALEKFMGKYRVSYPILLDEQDDYGKSFKVISIPTTVLLDQNGREIKRIVGPVSEHTLRKWIRAK